MEEAVTGTVASLASMFPADEAKKAAKRVEESIGDRQKEVARVREFIADNTSLINLVQKLPDHLHHDIMVPFGTAAFFPGRLIHTNEFLVLLGEGYYAERTSKETTEILKRRGKTLESQVNSLKAVIKDLRAEASFFDTTASEAAEGLVEIREEIGEEDSAKITYESGSPKPDSPKVSEVDNEKISAEDEEYAWIMSKLDELEEEELADELEEEEPADKLEEEEPADKLEEEEPADELEEEEPADELEEEEPADELEEEEPADELKEEELVDESINEDAAIVSGSDEDEQTETNFDQWLNQNSLDHNLKYSEEHKLRKPPQPSKDEHTTAKELLNKNQSKQDPTDQLNLAMPIEGLSKQSPLKGEMSHSKSLRHSSNSAKKASVLPEVKESVQPVPSSRNEAFTGSIVERTVNPREQTATSSQLPGSQPSKPVSRFKMQRR